MNIRPLCALLLGSIILGALAACTPTPPPPTPVSTTARIQCYSAGEIVFDQQFDRAEMLTNGHVKAWLGEESAELEGDCQIAP
jgi:hypothetical protein